MPPRTPDHPPRSHWVSRHTILGKASGLYDNLSQETLVMSRNPCFSQGDSAH